MTNRRRPSPAALAFALLAFLSAPAFAEDAAGEKPKLPEGVKALTPEMQKELDVLVQAAAARRGLKLKNAVAMGQLDEPKLKQKVLKMFDDELPAAKMAPLEKSLKSFGYIPEEMNLGEYYPKLLTSQIGGFYDPKEKYLVLIDREGGPLGPQGEKMFGKEMMELMSNTMMVHEITHAIQDQHFDLSKFGHDAVLDDAAAAKTALIEGDATLVMYGYMLNSDLERVPMVAQQMKMFSSNPGQLAAMMPDMPGAKELAEAPAYLSENLMFSYIQGMVFALEVKKAGGQKLLDHAFTKDPPRSTEQILHPEKWLAKRDDPVKIELPDLTQSVLQGFARIQEGTWGEFNIRLMLEEKLGAAGKAEAATAAEGWGGDRFAVYERDGARVPVWCVDFDTQKDAEEFKAAVAKALKDAAVTCPPEKKRCTVVLGGKLEAKASEEVNAKLAAAAATAPENKALDLAALGITDADKPKPLGMAEAMQMMNSPNLKSLMGAGMETADLDKLVDTMFDDPDMSKALIDSVMDMYKQMGLSMPRDQVEQVIKNPAMRQMMKSMIKNMMPKQPAAQPEKEGATKTPADKPEPLKE
ncbi:MAG: hypothetical protein L6R28_15325 [Planctomycetes bacterium]|nr:hypothetical protein [Planctomycetota bacterium]